MDPRDASQTSSSGTSDSLTFRVSNTLQNVLARISSNSAADRKRGAEELEEILGSSDTQELLNFNSLKPESQNRNSIGLLTWNIVFGEIKNYFEKTLRTVKSGPVQSQAYTLFKQVIDQSLAQGCPYLNLNTVFQFIYELIYNDTKIAALVGLGVVQLIYNILSSKTNLPFIDAASWKGLLLLLIKLYKSTKLPRPVLLETLKIVIVNSSNYPIIIPQLRKETIEFYRAALIEDPSNSLLYQGATLLCTCNALEFRGILCKFGEEIIGRIHFPTNNDLDESIIEFILVQLRLHSPCDVTTSSSGFYAHNAVKWIDLLQRIYAFCIDAIDWTSRKMGYVNVPVTTTGMWTLAVKITKQVSDLSHSSTNLMDEFPINSAAKRLMTHKSFVTVINDVILIPPCETQLLWLTYITGVLKSFPELVQSTSTIDRLFRMGMSLLNSSFSLRPELHTFLLSLYHAEQYFLKSKRKRKHPANLNVSVGSSNPWNQVWDAVIRSLMVQGEQSEASKCPEILELLRSLLVEIGQDMDLSLMLSLFLNHSLGPSEGTVNLLIEFLSRCKLPDFVQTSHTTRMFIISGETNKSCPRLALIHWIVTSLVPQILPLAEEKLGNLLCSLILKRSHTFLQSIYNSSFEFIIYEDNIFEPIDFEQVLLDMSFVKIDKKCGHDSSSSQNPKRKETFKILSGVASKLYTLLDEDLLQLPPIDKKSPDFIKKLSYLQYRIKILLVLENSLEPIYDETTVDFKETLVDLLVRSFQRYMSNITDHLITPKVQVPNLLAAMEGFYSSKIHFSDELKLLVQDSCPIAIRDFWISTCLKGFKAWSNDHNEFSCDDERGSVKVKIARQENSLKALRVLIVFGNFLDEEKRFQSFAELFQMVENIKSYHMLNQFYFDLSMELLHASISIFTENRFRALHKNIPLLLQALCRHYNNNPECSEKLWKLFKDLGPVMAKDSDEVEFHQYFMILVNALILKLKTTNSCYIPLVKAVFQAFAHFAKVKKRSDSTVKEKHETHFKSIYHNIPEFFKKESQQIRISVLNMFWDIFRSENYADNSSVLNRRFPDGSFAKASVLRKAIYEEVYTALMDLCEVKTGLSPDELNDETRNRTGVITSCLTNLVFIYPYNQKRALFSLFLIVKLKNLSMELTNAALKYYSTNPSKTLHFHLLYMLGKWLKLKYNINDFPYQLYDCNSYEEFAMKYRKQITYQCFFHNEGEGDQSLLGNYAKNLHTTTSALVEECFGLIMGRVLPSIGSTEIVGSLSSSSQRQINQARNVIERLTNLFGGNTSKEFQNHVSRSISEIFLNIISCTYQPDIMDRWNSPLRIPEPEPPFLDEEKTKIVLDYELKKLLNIGTSEVSVLARLIRTSGKSIFRILEPLLLRIHESHDELEKFWRLHQYSFFVKLIMSHPKEILSGQIHIYISNTVVYSYMRLLNPKFHGHLFTNAVLHVFYDFIKAICLLFPTEMEIQFRPIVHQLVSISSTINSAKLFEILNYLMVTSGPTYTKSITSLAPFPELTEFEPYRKVYLKYKYDGLEHLGRNTWSLERELQSSLELLRSFSENYPNSTVQLLKFIKVQLSERKPDLEQMVTKLGSFRFSDECKNSVLHNLVQVLIDVVKGCQDDELQLEACRCLGEIGPIDLGLLVLPNKRKNHAIISGERGILSTIDLVHTYLFSEDINLVTTSTSVLQELLKLKDSTNQIISYGKDKSRLVLAIHPFKSQPTPDFALTGSVPATLESKLMSIANSEYISFSNWIRDLTLGIISSLIPNENFFVRIIPLCKIKIDFCQEVLPFLVYSCLNSSLQDPLVRESLSKYFRKFFHNFTSSTSINQAGVNEPSSLEQLGGSQEAEAMSSIYTNKRALRALLDVIQFLRTHQISGGGRTPWENNFWLDVNYLDLAKAAQYCGAYLTTILYSEIYAYGLSDTDALPGQVRQDYSSQHDLQATTSITHAEIEKLLLKAYISIGEVDAVYGCGSARYTDLSSNLQHLEQMNQWNRALSAYDCQVTEAQTAQYGICCSLKEQGLLHTLWTFMDGVEKQVCGAGKSLDPKLEEIRYECGWRLSKWDFNSDKPYYLPGTLALTGQHPTFRNCPSLHKPLYESLQCGLSKDRFLQNATISRGYLNIVQDLKHSSLQSSENLYNFLTQFQMFRVVEDFYDLLWSGERLEQLTTNWKLQNRFSAKDLKFQEPILSLESVVLQSCIPAEQKNADLLLVNALDDITLKLATSARLAGRLELAENLVSKIIGPNMQSRKEIEIAINNWTRGETDIAMLRLANLIKRTAADRGADLYAAALILYGEWLVETKSESPSVILEQYFLPGVRSYEFCKAHASIEDIANAHITLAKYADSLYQNVNNYVKSDGYQEKVRTLAKLKEELEQLKRGGGNAGEQRKTLNTLEKHISQDSIEIHSTNGEITKFVSFALKHYLLGLKKSSSRHDLLIFRAIGLWLENTSIPETTKIIMEEILPSYKYVIVLHQLTARLGIARVQEALNTIITKCAHEHPHHALPVLLSLVLMNKDKDFLRGPNVKKNDEQNSRMLAARKILDTVQKNGLSDLVNRMENLWVSLISLANFQAGGKKTDLGPRHIPDNSPVRKLKGMEGIPIPTTTIDVSPTGTYQKIIGIKSFGMEFNLVGGVNSPKRISCLGTNGMTYNLLLKGQDDLRQDQVMQQVFGVMNQLLKNESSSKSRRLHIRTYKVVPLSQRSGVIEWVENTTTLGEYLVGVTKIGAHQLYRPQDISAIVARRKMMAATECGDNVKKLEAFNDILQKFKPVFRHFFFENFKEPGTFFERRIAYTRSVATSSMVGYILGLGDRHVANILIDKNTAEFVHIDLGVAFEQGKVLPTPETIPFRLTRDVVDGMGLGGVEGDFRRSCEITLGVLRNNAEIIVTVLEVLLYDPLYFWTLSTDRVEKVQPANSSSRSVPGRRVSSLTKQVQDQMIIDSPLRDEMSKEKNTSAARVLLRLKQKLVGVEEGMSSGSTLSVPGQVSLLIQRAMDCERLSRLFPGWQPYL